MEGKLNSMTKARIQDPVVDEAFFALFNFENGPLIPLPEAYLPPKDKASFAEFMLNFDSPSTRELLKKARGIIYGEDADK